ncbi:HEPN domain-containing protein [Micrococcus terreus]|uniref:HEPN domain-containing protein n=1 Tax=Micrococcus terreus TaxID=574650 RepID=UPI0035CCD195
MTRSIRWPPPVIRRLETALDELAKAVRERPEHRSDDEQMWLVRFLIVRSCGYLEQVMHHCAIGHLQEKSYGTARSYSLSWLSRSVNPSVENIRSTLGRFDAGFVEEFETMLTDGNGELANDLGALITKRHAIAHGENEGLGDRRALDLYEACKDLADWMVRRLNPDPGWGSSFSR